jgi:transcriptional regulator with XRE-family HTH domain
MSINEAIGTQVRHLRQTKGITQHDLAQKSGLSVDHIGKIERGTTSPTVDALDRISGGLGVSLKSLLDLHHSGDKDDTTALSEVTPYLRQKNTADVTFALGIIRQILDR